MRKRSKFLRLVLFIAGIILFIAAVYGVISGVSKVKTSTSQEAEVFTATEYLERMQGVLIDGEYYHKKNHIKTYLFIGLDKTGPLVSTNSYRNLNNADFLLLVVVNSEKKQIRFIEIDRDTMADVRRLDLFGREIGFINTQITLSYSFGDGLKTSAENTVKTVGGLFYGLPIDYYFVTNMDGALSIMDLFGEVPVLLEKDYTDIDSSYKKGRVVSMDAKEAFTFIRARRGLDEPTNQARIERQSLYLDSLMSHIKTIDISALDMSEYLKEGNGISVTNMDVFVVANLYNAFEKYSVRNDSTLPGEEVAGDEHMEFYPDKEALKNYCIEVLYDKY